MTDCLPSPVVAYTTESLIAEIESGIAAEVSMHGGVTQCSHSLAVMAMRYNTTPLGPTFIPGLDEHILAARPHPGGSSLQRGDLVEVVGPSGSGKTTFASFILMTTLLARSFSINLAPGDVLNVPLGGREMCAALIHSKSHTSPISLIERTMRAHISLCISTALAAQHRGNWAAEAQVTQDHIDQVVVSALQRLKIVCPRDTSLDWFLAIKVLLKPPEVILAGSTDNEGALDLLVCDGIADGFWTERWVEEEREEGRRGGPVSALGIRGTGDVGLREVWDAITALRRELGVLVLITMQGLRPIDNTPFFRPHLPTPYPSPFYPRLSRADPSSVWPLNIQLTLQGRSKTLQFPADGTVVEALRSMDSTARMQVNDAIVRVTGGKALAGTLDGAQWRFGIGDEGLVAFT